MTKVGSKVGNRKSISKCKPWEQREGAKSRSGLERGILSESLENPEGRAAPIPGVSVKGRCGQDLARGRERVSKHGVGIGWERLL